MTKPRALYYRILNYDSASVGLLKSHFDFVELESPLQDTDDILSKVELLFAPLGFPVDEAKVARCWKLRVVASNTTGIPHIDADAMARRGIMICALHDDQVFLQSITPTAEHTVGLMLAALRRIPAAHAAATRGEWSRWAWGAPRMLSRMRLGIVGMGRIGAKVARIADAMDMDVGYYDPHVEGGYTSVLALAARSDILSLHAPATAETASLISAQVIRTLPRGAVIVNTARGELLDTTALLEALEDGHLFAAALDTIEGEYDPGFADRFENSPIAAYARSHDNLVLTPHIGGSTQDAWRETQHRVIAKAMAVFGAAANP